MEALTPKQEAVFEFLLNSIREDSYVPTVREIAAAFGYSSTNAVRDHLAQLERKGYIQRRAHASRGIEINPDLLRADDERGIPIVGRVAAGAPITAIENLDGYLELQSLYEPGMHYALRVRGDSMVDAGIWDGDFCIVRDQPTLNNGEIGVAIVEGEATVKRIRVDGPMVELIPENDLYKPLRVDVTMTDFRIGGKVVGIHRVVR